VPAQLPVQVRTAGRRPLPPRRPARRAGPAPEPGLPARWCDVPYGSHEPCFSFCAGVRATGSGQRALFRHSSGGADVACPYPAGVVTGSPAVLDTRPGGELLLALVLELAAELVTLGCEALLLLAVGLELPAGGDPALDPAAEGLTGRELQILAELEGQFSRSRRCRPRLCLQWPGVAVSMLLLSVVDGCVFVWGGRWHSLPLMIVTVLLLPLLMFPAYWPRSYQRPGRHRRQAKRSS